MAGIVTQAYHVQLLLLRLRGGCLAVSRLGRVTHVAASDPGAVHLRQLRGCVVVAGAGGGAKRLLLLRLLLMLLLRSQLLGVEAMVIHRAGFGCGRDRPALVPQKPSAHLVHSSPLSGRSALFGRRGRGRASPLWNELVTVRGGVWVAASPTGVKNRQQHGTGGVGR